MMGVCRERFWPLTRRAGSKPPRPGMLTPRRTTAQAFPRRLASSPAPEAGGDGSAAGADSAGRGGGDEDLGGRDRVGGSTGAATDDGPGAEASGAGAERGEHAGVDLVCRQGADRPVLLPQDANHAVER